MLEDPAIAMAGGDIGFDADQGAAASDANVFAQTVGESESRGQMREALRDVIVGEKGEQVDGREE